MTDDIKEVTKDTDAADAEPIEVDTPPDVREDPVPEDDASIPPTDPNP